MNIRFSLTTRKLSLQLYDYANGQCQTHFTQIEFLYRAHCTFPYSNTKLQNSARRYYGGTFQKHYSSSFKNWQRTQNKSKNYQTAAWGKKKWSIVFRERKKKVEELTNFHTFLWYCLLYVLCTIQSG